MLRKTYANKYKQILELKLGMGLYYLQFSISSFDRQMTIDGK